MPLGLRYFFNRGFSLRLITTYVNQRGDFVRRATGELFSAREGEWFVDSYLSYKLPKQRGIVGIEIRNLLNNKATKLQESDPTNPKFSPGRTIFGRFVLAF